ncbi:hypothetical protein [Streptomyces yanii]
MLTDTVYEVVRQRVVDHHIEPGGKVNISALAQELDVSAGADKSSGQVTALITELWPRPSLAPLSSP